MVLNLNSISSFLAALVLAGVLSISGAIAQDTQETEENTSQEEQTAEATEDDEGLTEIAERTNSCKEYGRESAHWSLTVAYDAHPRNTPCVSDTGSRIRRSSDD